MGGVLAGQGSATWPKAGTDGGNMSVTSKFAVGLAAAALVAGAVGPAEARRYDSRWRHHHRGPDAGAVIGAIVGVGIIAAIASAASTRERERREADRRYDDRPYDDRAYDPRREDPRYDGRAGERGYDGGYDDGRADYAAEDEAVDACAVAARDEASRGGGFADIRDITGVRPFGNGWDVTGTVSQRAGYSASSSRQRSFRCIYEGGRVSGLTFGTSA